MQFEVELMLPIISYIRVSDKKQGRSGLGLEAQQEAIDRFTQFEGLKVVKEFVEVETAKGGDALERRPQLKAALAAAKKLGCYVVVSKLCRLSRNVHFISGLMEKEVPFVVVEYGFKVQPMMLHLQAVFAENERLRISTNTKAALAAKKARGCTLGSPVLHLARKAAAEVVSAKADAHAAKVLPIIRRLQKAGITSQRDIAKTLNDDGIKTARGGEWHSSSVGNVLKRAKD
jgi:DNA invertase Pin-like site-specific DNA recombinase